MDHTAALVQGIYFFMTGLWPILSMKTFLTITGPKTDLWLVKTVGLVLAVIGAVLFHAYITAAVNPPIVLLAVSSALSLTIVEIVYVMKRVISPVYLGDAALEMLLVAWWAIDLVL